MPDRNGIKRVDKRGEEFEITNSGFEERWALVEMYDRFTPKAITQGLPPANTDARYQWINSLLENGENFLAWHQGKLVGHASIIVDTAKRDGEYLIFMDQSCRNRGMGTELTRAAIEKARDMGLNRVWLTVEALNFRAIKLYRKMGFVFCDSGERERTMILQL
ncbi:MAG: GNAT family N-acetyltransferase [Desulfomonile tiedjei]|nr:GNAT family N-acetyltransferase [Desulfomonile tiedjei]